MASADDSNSGPARAQVKQEVKEEAYGRDTEDDASLPAPPASCGETEAEEAGRRAGAGGSAPPPDAVSVRILVPRCSPSDSGPGDDGGDGCDCGSATERREGDSALANGNGSPVARATGGGRGDAPSSTGAGNIHDRSQDDAMLADSVRKAKGVFEDEGGSPDDKRAFYEALRRASETYWGKANARRHGRKGCGVESGAAPVEDSPGGGEAKKRKGADAPSSSTKRRSTVATSERPTRRPVVKHESEQRSSTEPPPSEAGPAGLMQPWHEREGNGARANGEASAPAAARSSSPTKSTKQKEVPRQKIAVDMRRLGPKLLEGGVWNLRPSSFRSGEALPLDDVHFDEGRRRYRPRAGSDATEDDVILQAMVVFALYRMERGWGKGRSFRALSVWGGRPALGDGGDDDDDFPLKNLWKEEIRQCIDDKRLGKNTLGHADNYDNFPPFYMGVGGTKERRRWDRRSGSFVGQLHVFAEQAVVQLALHLHRHVSEKYALLASVVVRRALSADRLAMTDLLESVIRSSRKETPCFPETALDDLKRGSE